MGNPKRLKLIIITIFAVVLTACGEDNETTVPIPQDVSTVYLDSCISGKGWTQVSSREIKANGTLDNTEYWSLTDAGKPAQYFFSGDTITTYITMESSDVKVYKASPYTYNRETHQMRNKDGEVFKLISVSPTQLCVVEYKGFSGNGDKTYIYSVYRPMEPQELVSCRSSYIYNLATINSEYPMLPEQMSITPNDFISTVVNHGWKCTAAFRMETATRYSAIDIQKLKSHFVPNNLYFTSDTMTVFERGNFNSFKINDKRKYSYKANSYSLEIGIGNGLRIIALTADEMRLVLPSVSADTQQRPMLYCIYKRMSAQELAMKK